MTCPISTRFAFSVVLVALGPAASAQMGIRFGAQHEKPTQARFGSDWHLVLGWDFDLNERLSGGLDLSTDMNWSSEYNMPEAALNGPTFYEKVKTFGVQYRSQFHFADNDDGGSFYLGPTIGLRAVRHRISYYEETSSGGYYSSDLRETEEKGMIYPLGLRLGVRSGLDGGYGDYYIAIGTNIASGDGPINDLRFLSEESLPNKLFFQAGLCYGVGW